MRTLILFGLLCISTFALANIEAMPFSSSVMEQRYNKLIEELRCLVCQNQNLADSNAELAQDLRRQVYKMLGEGKSDQEIIDFMVNRYGDFVLYRPPFKARTLFLWLGPFLFLLLGIWFLIRYIQTQVAKCPSILSNDERQRANALLEEHDQDKDNRSA